MKNRFNKFLSLFLVCVMAFSYVAPIAEVFAANTSYGTTYPSYSSQFPNTVIVNDNGEYVAFQTSANIYYANDKKYLMVDELVPIQKLVWLNGTWTKDSVYTSRFHIRDVEIGTETISLYNISNETVGGGQKSYGVITDCNVDIINYNTDAAISAGSTRDSSLQEIANWGLAMMDSPYNLIEFSDGDGLYDVRENFRVKNSFVVGDLSFTIDWKVEGEGASLKPGTGGYHTIEINRPYLSELAPGEKTSVCKLKFTVIYSDHTGSAESTSSSIDFHVLPRGYISNENVESEIEKQEWIQSLPDFTSSGNSFISFMQGDQFAAVSPGNAITVSAKEIGGLKIVGIDVPQNGYISPPQANYNVDDPTVIDSWSLMCFNDANTMKFNTFTIKVEGEYNDATLSTDIIIPILIDGANTASIRLFSARSPAPTLSNTLKLTNEDGEVLYTPDPASTQDVIIFTDVEMPSDGFYLTFQEARAGDLEALFKKLNAVTINDPDQSGYSTLNWYIPEQGNWQTAPLTIASWLDVEMTSFNLTRQNTCVCQTKCTAESHNDQCNVCLLDIANCTGPEESGCTCTTKCEAVGNPKCPVCADGGGDCSPTLTCICNTKCDDENSNPNCNVCKNNPENCTGSGSVSVTCSCDIRCDDSSTNSTCDICRENPTLCTGPICNCNIKCDASSDTTCPACSQNKGVCRGPECTCIIKCNGVANNNCKACREHIEVCKANKCTCDIRCGDTPDSNCSVCQEHKEVCVGPICTCDINCEDVADTTCTACSQNKEVCKGPECTCDIKCDGTADATCPACKNNIDVCRGPECTCKIECNGVANNSCPACKEHVEVCKGPKCTCDVKCDSGYGERTCDACSKDESVCIGPECVCPYICEGEAYDTCVACNNDISNCKSRITRELVISPVHIQKTNMADSLAPYTDTIILKWTETVGGVEIPRQATVIFTYKDIDVDAKFYRAEAPTGNTGFYEDIAIENIEVATMVNKAEANHYVILEIKNNSKATIADIEASLNLLNNGNPGPVSVKNMGEVVVNNQGGRMTYTNLDTTPTDGLPAPNFDFANTSATNQSITPLDGKVNPQSSKYYLLYFYNTDALNDAYTTSLTLEYSYVISDENGEFKVDIPGMTEPVKFTKDGYLEKTFKVSTSILDLTLSGFKIYNDTDIAKIIEVMNDVNGVSVDLTSDTFKTETIIEGLNKNELGDLEADGIYSSGELGLDNFETSTYYGLFVSNLNAVDATDVTLNLTTNDTSKTKVEFIGTITKGNDDKWTFVEVGSSNQFIKGNRGPSVTSQVIPANSIIDEASRLYVIRVSTTVASGGETNLAISGSAKVQNKGFVEGLTADFSISDNPFSLLVNFVADLFESNKNNIVNGTQIVKTQKFNNNYLLISKLTDGDVLTDITHDFNVATNYADVAITWELEHVIGNGFARFDVQNGVQTTTITGITRGTTDTIYLLKGTLSRGGVSRVIYIPFRIPAKTTQVFRPASTDETAEMDNIGLYYKTATGYIVSTATRSYIGSSVSELNNVPFNMIVDNNTRYRFVLTYKPVAPPAGNREVGNGWNLPIKNAKYNNFEFVNGTPNGSAISNYNTSIAYLEVVPSTINFENSYSIKTTGENSNTLTMKFTKGTSYAYGDGDRYKTKTYSPTQLFLDKYYLPDFAQANENNNLEPFAGYHVIIIHTGENLLMLKSTKEWVVRNGAFSPAPSGTATVDVYTYANEWIPVTTLNDIDASSTFADFTKQNGLNSLIFASDDIYSVADYENKKEDSVTPVFKENYYEPFLVTGTKYQYAYSPRIFSAKGLTLTNKAATTIRLDGIELKSLHYVNEITYFAVNNANQVNIYNAISEEWSGWKNVNAFNTTIEEVTSFKEISTHELMAAAWAVDGATKTPVGAIIPIVAPYSSMNINDATDFMIIAQPNGGIRMVTYSGQASVNSNGNYVFSGGSAKEYIMTDFSWKLVSEDDSLLNRNGVYNDKFAQYTVVANQSFPNASSSMEVEFGKQQILPIRLNFSNYQNLPRPTTLSNADNAIMIYDGQYKILVGNVPFTINPNTKEVEMEVTRGTSATVIGYGYSSNGTWVRVTSADGTYSDVDGDGVVNLGIYAHELIWNAQTIMYTKSTSTALNGIGLSAMTTSAKGMINLANKSSAGLPYYVWDTKNPRGTFVLRIDKESISKKIPINLPTDEGSITTSNNATPPAAGSTAYTNIEIPITLYVPNFDKIVQFANIIAIKNYPGNTGSVIKIKDGTVYETNIKDEWFSSADMTEDITKPHMKYAYMMYKTIYWEGADGYYNQAGDWVEFEPGMGNQLPEYVTEEVSGMNKKNPYGIKFETEFPLAEDVSGYVFDETTKTFTMTTYPSRIIGANGEDINGTIPAGTTLWFPYNSISIWNYYDEGKVEDTRVSFYVMDNNYNISDPLVATPIKEEDHMELGGDVPADIKNKIEEANKDTGDVLDPDAPQITAIYMYRGHLYITAEDYSVDGRTATGLAPYPYVIVVDRDKAVSLTDANERFDGLAGKIDTLRADVVTYSAVGAIPLGDLTQPVNAKISVVDNAGNHHQYINFDLDKFDDNTVLYGTVPAYVQKLLDAAKGESLDPTKDTEPPRIIAAYVNGVADPSTLNVIAEDNSGGQVYYKFVLRASGETEWSTNPSVDLQVKDSGVARIYVKDAAGNEASCTVFINASESEIVYGEEGDIPPEILDAIKVQKKDTTPPVITSVYVYNGRIYVKGYDDVKLHNSPYGWTPQEDMIIGSNFTGTTLAGEYINIPGGKIIKNGTEIWNSNNSMEVMIPMSFTISLRDASGNISSYSFFIAKDNVLLEGTAPTDIEHLLDTGKEQTSKFDVNQSDNKLTIGMTSDFKAINWEKNDYKVDMYTSDHRLIYSIAMDIGGSVIMPLFTEGETVTIIETVIDEVSQVEVMQAKKEFEIADKTPPVITNVYMMGEKLFVEAYDDINLGDAPYNFTIENVKNPIVDNFSSTSSVRIMPGDSVIVKVRDKAGNVTSLTVRVTGTEQTILKNLNPRNPIVVNSGDSKSLIEWDILIKKHVTIPYGYEINKESENSALRINATDGVIVGSEYGVIEYHNPTTDEYINVAVKIEDSGKTGRTNIVQTDSLTNFILLFEDTLSKTFGTQNGVYWTIEDAFGLRKEGEYVRALEPGIHKIIATKGDQNINFYLLVEDRMDMNLTPLTFESPNLKYTYLNGTTLLYEAIFDVTKVPETQLEQVLDRILVEEHSQGLTCKDGRIVVTTPGRKKVTFIDMLTDISYVIMFDSVELHYGIGNYPDASNSFAKEHISLLSQVGALEKNYTDKFMPLNPISMKEFISNINRLSMIYNCNIEYSKTDEAVSLVTRDWDFYNVYNFMGYSNGAIMHVTEENVLSKPITRGDAAVLLQQSILINQPHRTNLAQTAVDVTDPYVAEAVSHLSSLKVITLGQDGCFRPNDELTRAEMAVMLGNAVKYLR